MTNKVKMTMTKAESDQVNVQLDQYKINLVSFKGSTHDLAYLVLVHFHNTGELSLVQKFYDILAEDKLLRKAGFAKWILEYAPAVFSDEKKTFSKNKNPNSGKSLYKDNKDQGASLLASANAKRFWEMDGGNESVNRSTPDKIMERVTKLIEAMVKENEKGEIPAEFTLAYSKIIPLFKSVIETVTPVTTKELEKQAVIVESEDDKIDTITENQAAAA